MKNFFIICIICLILSAPLCASLTCSNCGSVITGTYWQSDGNIYCGNCYEQPLCDRCGNTLSGQYYMLEGKNYCKNCYEAVLPKCKICNALIEGEFFTDNNNKYCKKCYDFYSHCSICGVPGGPCGISLPDGRTLCSDCYSTAIFDEKKVEKIFEDVKEDLKKSPGLSVAFPVKNIKIVDKTRLNELLANKTLEYIPQDGVSGLHYYEKINGRITISEIYVLNGLTPGRLRSVIAHEYSHAWQAENCPDKQESIVREGFAEWVSYRFLKEKGYKSEAEDMIKTGDPVYGGGLKKYLEIEKKYKNLGVFNYAKGGDPASKIPVVVKPDRTMFLAEIIPDIQKINFNKFLWFFLILLSLILIFWLIFSIIKEFRRKI